MNNIRKVLHNYKNFGFIYGTSFLLTKTLLRKFEHKTRLRAIKILDKKFGYLFDANSTKTNKNLFTKNIFVFWGQGFDKLPEIPAVCIEKIEKLYPDYNIYKIDLNNFCDYVEIDTNILKLFNQGKISIQTFSDILRYSLLYKYGGVWCDATLLFFERIDFEEKLELNSWYSLNIDCYEKNLLWGKVYPITYTTFFCATPKNSPILESIVRAYEKYYECYDFVLDYFLNDYFFIIAMKHHMENDALSNIEYNIGNPFYLLNKIHAREKVIDKNECRLCPQKLTWKNISLLGIEIDG